MALDLPAEGVEAAEGVLHGPRPDVGAKPAADLQEPVRDEPAERLPDGRPADTVAGHELQLGLHLGAGQQLAARHPVAQVEHDALIERQPGGHDRHVLPIP